MLVKTIQFQNPRHIGEPIYAIKIFNDYEVDELIILDINASRQSPSGFLQPHSRIPFELISKISDESWMPVTYGGGVNSLQDLNDLFKAGIEKVSINTAAVTNPQFIQEASSEFGNQSIVVSIDIKKKPNGPYEIFSHCGTWRIPEDPIQFAAKISQMGAGELLINSIDRDGTMTGYDIPLLKSIVNKVNIPVIALGGAGTTNDFNRALREAGASAVAAGSMFVYFGRKKAVLINYPNREEIIEILK